VVKQGERGVRRQFSQDDYLRPMFERLERVSRAMNPLLLYIAVSLVVLNLACVTSLIDWNNLPQPAAETAAAGPSNTPGVK
jgi:hypothetical protein